MKKYSEPSIYNLNVSFSIESKTFIFISFTQNILDNKHILLLHPLLLM